MTYNLRLPPELDVKARSESRKRYISLNSLICQALANYLKDVPVKPSRFVTVVANPKTEGKHQNQGKTPEQSENSKMGIAPGPGATKKERQAYTNFLRQQRKLEA